MCIRMMFREFDSLEIVTTTIDFLLVLCSGIIVAARKEGLNQLLTQIFHKQYLIHVAWLKTDFGPMILHNF